MINLLNSIQKDELNQKALIISMYIDNMYPNKDFEYFELEQIVRDLMSGVFRELTSKCDKEAKDYIVNKIMESKPIHFGKALYVTNDDNRSWYTDDTERKNDFFNRYSRYLQREKGFKTDTIKDLCVNVLDPIMNQFGNPKADKFSTHGLIMGDVQSGKTMTYIGLINKAADAGYKLIIILTGTIESLRNQTQERVDLGFIGFDSDSVVSKDTKFIGVGLDKLTKSGTRFSTSFTTRIEDFNSKLANSISTSLDLVNGPAIMVVKKNVSILTKMHEWLKEQHGILGDATIKHPLLMIDDEADNASINTKDDEDSDPTKTNACIRRLLKLFSKYSYVGFTATPFANVFINPDVYNEELGEDLFPSDFIFSLVPPETYIGAKDIFLDDSKYKNALITNDDCGEVLPASHKKYSPFTKLPNTLKEALICFALTNAIRDLRGDKTSHRSMLINISRYIVMHGVIEEYVNEYFEKIKSAFFNYGKMNSSNEIIDFAKEIFDREYCHCNQQWKNVKENLYDSNKNVKLLSVNTSNTMVNYKEYEETGARFIFIGGLSLSRGLTLEGLCVSYFYRYSKTYDVLFQMGRWFGYRVGYEDLFRIYMPKELIGWYSKITEAVEELKRDLIRMREAGKKPIDFGIRIQNDSSTLKITSSNKMRSAVSAYKTVIGFGEVIPTPDIINDVKTNENNIAIISDVFEKICSETGKQFEKDENTSNTCIRDIPLKYILEIVENLKISSANDLYDKESLKSFISIYANTYFSKWDIAIIEGDKKINNNIYNIPLVNLKIHKSMKQFDVINNYIRMQGSYEQLNNPIDTATCLDKKIVDELEKKCKEDYLKINPSGRWVRARIPSKRYLEFKNRNPLLMLYFIELSETNATDSTLKIKDKFDHANVPPFAIAFGIPRYEDTLTEKTLYKINLVEQRKRREKEYNYLTDDDYEEEIV